MGLLAWFKKERGTKAVVKVVPLARPHKKVVRPDNTPLYLRRGWSQKGNLYQGYYRTIHGAWPGEIERRGDRFKVFIFKPPQEQLRKHSRWACFHRERNNKWRIDLAINPKDGDISAIIFYVEKLVLESFRL